MFSQAAMSSINARKYALTMKAAKGAPKKHEGLELEVSANMGELIVKEKGQKLQYGMESTILFISADYTDNLHPDADGGYYVNHDAGFQRWHKHGCSRVEALGYAKQVGVTVEQFKEAFPWTNPNIEEKDPINEIKEVDTKVECDACHKKVDVDATEALGVGDVSICEDCNPEVICGHCGQYYINNESWLLIHDERKCVYCAEDAIKKGEAKGAEYKLKGLKSTYSIVSAESDYNGKLTLTLKNIKTGKTRKAAAEKVRES